MGGVLQHMKCIHECLSVENATQSALPSHAVFSWLLALAQARQTKKTRLKRPRPPLTHFNRPTLNRFSLLASSLPHPTPAPSGRGSSAAARSF